MQIPLKKLVRRVVLGGFLVAGVLGGATNAYASVEYLYTDSCGNTYWYSSGSSAGDTVWRCPAGGGPCTGYDPGVVIENCNIIN
jgi:hypothetical protein